MSGSSRSWRASGPSTARSRQLAPARGNLVPDAHVAAILKQNGIATFFTNDADFRRFTFLDLRDPFGTT